MLKPVYIICCELSLHDTATGLLSFMNIIEKVVFSKNAQQPTPPGMSQMRIFTAWMAEREDMGHEYEFNTSVVVPGSDEVIDLHHGNLICGDEGFVRITTHILGMPPVKGAGIMRLRGRIRRAGSDKWITQEYPIVFQELSSPANASATQVA
jgi:hypothetical protein